MCVLCVCVYIVCVCVCVYCVCVCIVCVLCVLCVYCVCVCIVCVYIVCILCRYPLKLTWKGQQKVVKIHWFQYESDPSLNSNMYEVASKVTL